ncbi:MAG: hypothetical protein AB7P52_00660 [Alphaproteobacteria bacterium]
MPKADDPARAAGRPNRARHHFDAAPESFLAGAVEVHTRRRGDDALFVMPRLDRGIQGWRHGGFQGFLDCPVKPGNDGSDFDTDANLAAFFRHCRVNQRL